MTIPVILLAAGSASRFGADKLGVVVNGRSLLHWTIAFALETVSPRHVHVVLGRGQDDRFRVCDASGVETVIAPESHRGMRWSLRSGLDACSVRAPGAIVALADDPLALRSLPAVLDAATRDPLAIVAVRRTPFLPHPVYLPRRCWPGRPVGDDDRGVRALLGGETTWVEGESTRPVDIDVPDDVARLARALRSADEA